MDLFEKIKGWLTLTGVNFGAGTGFSLSKMKATPYIKISFHPCAFADFGPIVTTLGELGLAVGLKISKNKDKAKIWLDAGAVIDGDLLFKSIKDGLKLPPSGLFGGFRITF